METATHRIASSTSATFWVTFQYVPHDGVSAVKTALEEAHTDDPWVSHKDGIPDDQIRFGHADFTSGNDWTEIKVSIFPLGVVPAKSRSAYALYCKRLNEALLEKLAPYVAKSLVRITHEDGWISQQT